MRSSSISSCSQSELATNLDSCNGLEVLRQFHFLEDIASLTFRLMQVKGLPSWVNSSSVTIKDVIQVKMITVYFRRSSGSNTLISVGDLPITFILGICMLLNIYVIGGIPFAMHNWISIVCPVLATKSFIVTTFPQWVWKINIRKEVFKITSMTKLSSVYCCQCLHCSLNPFRHDLMWCWWLSYCFLMVVAFEYNLFMTVNIGLTVSFLVYAIAN